MLGNYVQQLYHFPDWISSMPVSLPHPWSPASPASGDKVRSLKIFPDLLTAHISGLISCHFLSWNWTHFRNIKLLPNSLELSRWFLYASLPLAKFPPLLRDPAQMSSPQWKLSYQISICRLVLPSNVSKNVPQISSTTLLTLYF